MTTSPLLAAYQNGNCAVRLYRDGTKVREWSGAATPRLPESIDLKITDYCDAACSYCHESSTRRGQHADLKDIYAAVDGLPAGTEMAIGGGNPLAHPHLAEMLRRFRCAGLVANLTVNAKHLRPYAADLRALRAQGLIYGLGISYHPAYVAEVDETEDADSVVHVIAGIHTPHAVRRLLYRPRKVLMLGYKVHGFGRKHDARQLDGRLAAWRYWIGPLLRDPRCLLSFDNLALCQLGIRSIIPPETWAAHYMGDDGRFTMYIDAVRREYAVSSTSPRMPIDGRGIAAMFAAVQNQPYDPTATGPVKHATAPGAFVRVEKDQAEDDT